MGIGRFKSVVDVKGTVHARGFCGKKNATGAVKRQQSTESLSKAMGTPHTTTQALATLSSRTQPRRCRFTYVGVVPLDVRIRKHRLEEELVVEALGKLLAERRLAGGDVAFHADELASCKERHGLEQSLKVHQWFAAR
jgi:hypothetical protein